MPADIILRGVTTTQVNQEYGSNPSAAFVQQSRQHNRYAEKRLEYLNDHPQLSSVHEQVLLCEQVALNPHPTNGRVPGLRAGRGRPLARPINDVNARIAWIARQMSMTPDLVKELLEQATYYRAHEAMLDE